MVTTIGMWVHVVLVVGTVMWGADTRNPIWSELRAGLAAVVVVVLWVIIDTHVQM